MNEKRHLSYTSSHSGGIAEKKGLTLCNAARILVIQIKEVLSSRDEYDMMECFSYVNSKILSHHTNTIYHQVHHDVAGTQKEEMRHVLSNVWVAALDVSSALHKGEVCQDLVQ